MSCPAAVCSAANTAPAAAMPSTAPSTSASCSDDDVEPWSAAGVSGARAPTGSRCPDPCRVPHATRATADEPRVPAEVGDGHDAEQTRRSSSRRRPRRAGERRRPTVAPLTHEPADQPSEPTARIVPGRAERQPALVDEHQRDVGDGAEERAGQQEPRQHHRRQAAAHQPGAARQQHGAATPAIPTTPRRDDGLDRPAELEVVRAPLQRTRGRRDEHPAHAARACCRRSRLDSSMPSSALAICPPAGPGPGERHHDGEHHEPEDPAPRPGRRDPRGDRRTEQRGQHPRGRDDAEHLGAQRLRVGAADDDVARRR